MKNKWTGERLETFVYNENMIEHLHRYSIAIPYVKHKTVLDIASGEGYGSNLLSREAQFVFGVDIDAEAVAAAEAKYGSSKISFLQGSADEIPVETGTIDVVVSFETLEHHDKHEEMLAEIKRVLKPGGLLIMSSPDKKYYTDVTGYVNKFHVRELYADEFRALISRYFKHGAFLNQRFLAGSLITAERRELPMEVHSGKYEKLNSVVPFTPVYNLVIASDDRIREVADSIFTADEWYNILAADIAARFTSSFTWRIGSMVVKPLNLIRKIVRSN
ncbi:class I SAM-dependent methyltransferase [Mucilaginibacter sp. BJC16-A38]|uniref:class I SAM-dependent methyltransferase n=1 Tax=Mucilaginibacter phenanthrenivorans TaxID=1234842 RepID=UPI002157D689|nr:class I SAM-dependent methyltransferase [Mucilaginibacter phenanthrenivorans]MCR8560186.1 class I SAM-dependent methyltransferase [Mucilaginibacter phenanthrenivorans]